MLAVLALDGNAAPLRINPDDAGGMSVHSPRTPVVVSGLDAVAIRTALNPNIRTRLGDHRFKWSFAKHPIRTHLRPPLACNRARFPEINAHT